MSYRKSNCRIELPEKDPLGVYANSVRLTQDGAEILLDFCVYSETEDRARVQSRVRVSPEFLRVIVNKIEDSLQAPSSPLLFFSRKPS